jgi:glycerol-3-phosphate acyltransferase PlsY
MYTAVWIAAGLLLGSLPFSYWVGRVFLKKDIRDYGDGNPGATNVFNAGGLVPYVFAGLLDALKATLPVWLAQALSQVNGWELSLVALAPLVGNAFTPFLQFRGGTGVAVVYGIWLGLTGWIGPVVIALCYGLLFLFIREMPWCIIFGMLLFTGFLLIAQYPVHMMAASTGHAAIMAYNRRRHFTHWPKIQQWVRGQSRKTV